MGGILVVAEVRDGKLFSGTLSAVQFAQQVGQQTGAAFDIFVAGSNIGSIAEELSYYGAKKVLVEDNPVFAHYLAPGFAASVAAAAKQLGSSYVAGTATTFGKDLLPRVAVRLGAGMASEVTEIVGTRNGRLVFKRPMWAGNIVGHVVVNTDVVVVSVRGTDFDKAVKLANRSEVVPFTGGGANTRVQQRFISFEQTASERPDLTEAAVVVAGGRGLKDGPNFFKIMEPLADSLNAAIGASRAAVDAGFCPNDLQVGQTGKVVAPQLYVAVAISGAIQHLAGMKNSKTIVAINKDKEAPIFQIADYGLVGDAFKVVPELADAIKRARS
ncbi:MAG: electron transfer flavoprotein subunit alpha/FixB family protein [Myxococcales bacterium]|nr:electron transfer flavoprotein subunit alpha/FixB family protein [Myxococcales bacterium]